MNNEAFDCFRIQETLYQEETLSKVLFAVISLIVSTGNKLFKNEAHTFKNQLG